MLYRLRLAESMYNIFIILNLLRHALIFVSIFWWGLLFQNGIKRLIITFSHKIAYLIFMALWRGAGDIVLAIFIQCWQKITLLKKGVIVFFRVTGFFCGIIKECLLLPLLHTIDELDLKLMGKICSQNIQYLHKEILHISRHWQALHLSFYSTNHSILNVVTLVVSSILLVPYNLYKVDPINISLVSTLVGSQMHALLSCRCTCLVWPADSHSCLWIWHPNHICSHSSRYSTEHGFPYSTSLDTKYTWIFSSVLTVVVIHIQTKLGYIDLCTDQHIHICWHRCWTF